MVGEGSAGLIGITGATGGVGGRVAAKLEHLGVRARVIVRDPARLPETSAHQAAQVSGYGDFESMRRACDGVATLLLVSAAEELDRVTLHKTAIDAAAAAGVERVVYTSFVNAAPDATFTFARDHFHTERYIRASGVGYTFLRDSMYIDFIPWLATPEGVIRGPAGSGRFAPVARDDVADVALAALTTTEHEARTYDVTGGELLTMNDIAEELARGAGRRVTYQEETLEEARASRAPTGAPEWAIEGWVTSYAAIAAGDLEVVSDTVATVAGHEPVTLRDFLAQHPESYAHLRSG